MLIRRERAGDAAMVAEVVASAFATPDNAQPVEVRLLAALRDSTAWLPRLSLVALQDEQVVGHVVCSRAWVGQADVLALGPLAVRPKWQRSGVGSALMHAVLAAAEARDEPLVALLGHADYYPRFGFVRGDTIGIRPPVQRWGAHFQVRPLADYDPSIRGEFR